MPKRKKSPLWEYLEASGVLEKGTDEDIKAVKNNYRKKYFIEFKKRQRENNREFTIHFSKVNGELGRIKNAAKKHHRSVPGFLKAAAFAYLDRTYIVPDRLLVATLQQLLSDCLNEIKSISHKKERFWEREQKLDRIEKLISRLDEQLNEVFANPQLYHHDHQNQIS